MSKLSCFHSSEHDLGEDIYDCVPCEDEGDDIYEDIIKVEVQQPMVTIYASLKPYLDGNAKGKGNQPMKDNDLEAQMIYWHRSLEGDCLCRVKIPSGE